LVAEPKRDRVRRQLLEAAARLIAARGVAAVNSNQIAREAGLGVGTFYTHFADKAAVRHAIALGAVEQLRARVESAVGAAGPDLEAQVRALVAAVVGFAEAAPAQFRVTFAPGTSEPTAGRAAVALSDRATERRLAALRDRGALDPAIDPAVAARGFAIMQSGLLCWWLEDPARASRTALVETLVRLHPALAGRAS